MKKNLIWAMVALTAISYSSCKKDDAVNNPIDTQSARNSGVVADNPADIARVPLYVSSQFMQNGGSYTSYVAPDPSNGSNGSNGNNGSQAKGPVRTTRDNTPPTVAITSPSNGSSVSGTVSISVSASDNVSVTSVTLTVNGSNLYSWTTAPYQGSWTPATDGNYTLTATAKDYKGNSASYSIVVNKSTTIIVTPPPTTNLPSSFIMQTPPVIYQGGEGSCLSIALSYQRSIEAYYRANATSYSNSTNITSPEFLYNYTKVNSGCGSGAALMYSMDFLRVRGICSWNSLPYSDQNGCDTSVITTSMQNEALNFRIGGYHYMLATDLIAVKTSLANKHPLSFSFQMDRNFYNAYPGYIWDSRGELMYTHALTLVGYDDSKKAFKAINGWGTTWGDQGFIWIDYNFFGTICSYVYQMD